MWYEKRFAPKFSAMSPVAISLSPNTQPDDIRRAWRALLLGPPKQFSQTEIINSLHSFLPHQSIHFFSSGRGALYHLLKTQQIGLGDEVIIQAFTCMAVPAAIMWTGATPIYADINISTYNVDLSSVASRITPRTKAIIVQHTFGIPGPIEPIKKICQERNLLLIEDCAHAIGAKVIGAQVQNQFVGTIGQAGILSFGRDKALSSVFGGAVVSSDSKIIQSLEQVQQNLTDPPTWWVRQQLLHPILLDLLVPWYFTAHLGKIYLVLLQRLGILSKVIENVEKAGKPPQHVNWRYSPTLASLLELQAKKLPDFIRKRQDIAAQYQEAFTPWSKSLPAVSPHNTSSWLRFPVRVNDARRVLHLAQKKKMLLGDWYDGPLAPVDCNPAEFHYQPGACPKAEKLKNTVINLPTHPRLKEKQVHAVIDFVRGILKHDSAA